VGLEMPHCDTHLPGRKYFAPYIMTFAKEILPFVYFDFEK
jgi:hypothetical protein